MPVTKAWTTAFTAKSKEELSPWLLSALVWLVRGYDRSNRISMTREPETRQSVLTTFSLETKTKPHQELIQAVCHLIAGSCPRDGEVFVSEIATKPLVLSE